jgi:hypothetical protein
VGGCHQSGRGLAVGQHELDPDRLRRANQVQVRPAAGDPEDPPHLVGGQHLDHQLDQLAARSHPATGSGSPTMLLRISWSARFSKSCSVGGSGPPPGAPCHWTALTVDHQPAGATVDQRAFHHQKPCTAPSFRIGSTFNWRCG